MKLLMKKKNLYIWQMTSSALPIADGWCWNINEYECIIKPGGYIAFFIENEIKLSMNLLNEIEFDRFQA